MTPAIWSAIGVYAVGYFLWSGYAVNRFIDDPASDDGLAQYCLGLVWPICLAIYLPYRAFKWLGVRK